MSATSYQPNAWHIHTEFYPWPAYMLHEALGLIPGFLDPADTRPAVDQFREKYCGGWDNMPGFRLIDGITLKYSGDPPMQPIATCYFREEVVMVYPYAWVCVRQPDGTFEAARMD